MGKKSNSSNKTGKIISNTNTAKITSNTNTGKFTNNSNSSSNTAQSTPSSQDRANKILQQSGNTSSSSGNTNNSNNNVQHVPSSINKTVADQSAHTNNSSNSFQNNSTSDNRINTYYPTNIDNMQVTKNQYQNMQNKISDVIQTLNKSRSNLEEAIISLKKNYSSEVANKKSVILQNNSTRMKTIVMELERKIEIEIERKIKECNTKMLN